MLVNGKSGNLISIRDRGLLYGDGVFRTMLARNGYALHSRLHLQKLQQDCAKLGITCPALSRLADELQTLLAQHPEGIIKLIVTRGLATRGYAPPLNAEPSHMWDVVPLPIYPEDWANAGVTVRMCDIRLSEQPRLAGVKHLNRLENVLAAAEWNDTNIAEGLLLDARDHVIEGTRSNLFVLRGGVLYTPDLSRCGVAGVQRDRVLAYAAANNISMKICDLTLDEILAADEVFLVNSVIGVWPVRALQTKRWGDFTFTHRLQAQMAQEDGV